MTAENKPRITIEGRTKLETVIPLATPYLVFLDPSSICNSKCPWCPTGNGESIKYYKPGLMDWRLYGKIIDGFNKFPDRIKTLRLYLMGEPLLNPMFTRMVELAKWSGCFDSIDTTTNGLLLNPSLSKELVLSGLDKIFISVPNNYTDKYVENVQYLMWYSKSRCLVYCKIIDDGKTDINKFKEDFADNCNYINVEYPSPCWPGLHEAHSDNNKSIGIYGQPIEEAPLVCPYLFYSISINSDGTVSACFLDWKRKNIVGDLKADNISDVWNGNIMNTYRTFHLLGLRKDNTFCGNCGQLTHCAPDNIDIYAKELLERIENDNLWKW